MANFLPSQRIACLKGRSKMMTWIFGGRFGIIVSSLEIVASFGRLFIMALWPIYLDRKEVSVTVLYACCVIVKTKLVFIFWEIVGRWKECGVWCSLTSNTVWSLLQNYLHAHLMEVDEERRSLFVVRLNIIWLAPKKLVFRNEDFDVDNIAYTIKAQVVLSLRVEPTCLSHE